MNRDGMQRHLTQIWQRSGLAWLQRTILIIAHAPFQFDLAQFATHTPDEMEQQRRVALLRAVILSFFAYELVLSLVTAFTPYFPPMVRWAELGEIITWTMSLVLSYHHQATLAAALFVYGSFLWLMFLAWTDPGGLNQRSIVTYCLVTLIFIGSGLLLAPHAARLASGIMAVIALGSVWLQPLKTPVSPTIRLPHSIAFFSLLFLYAFTAILTQMYTRSARTSMAALQQAYERERQLEAMAEEFIHVASHELRAPLNPIIFTSGIIKQRLSKPERLAEVPPLVDELMGHAKRMSDLVGTLLDSTRIHAGRFIINPAPCDAAQIIRAAVTNQEQQWQRTVTLQGVETAIPAVLDETRLWQLVTNLVGNALKYTPENTLVVVAVDVTQKAATTQEWLSLRVQDQGPGIAAAHLPHLFDRFYRGVGAESAENRKEGLGLGLYICQAIVAAHGGTIAVDSVIDQGTTFLVELPLVTAG
jgi:signal transduction histidine kinase